MLRREDASTQVARLSARKGFQNLDVPGQDELIDTLVRCCRDAGHAEAVVTAWNRSNEWVPQPSELWSLAGDFPEPRRQFAGCKRCDGSGFMVTRFIRTRRQGQEKPTYDRLPDCPPEQQAKQWEALQDGQDIVETSGWCVCSKGQHFRSQKLKADAVAADAQEIAARKHADRKAQWEAKRT